MTNATPCRNALVITNVSGVTDPLSAVAEPTRRRVLQVLAAGPRSVSQVAAEFDVSRSAISQHLAVLQRAGLVGVRPSGRERIYHLEPSGLRRLHDEIDRFWTAELDLLVADAESVRAARRTVAPAPLPAETEHATREALR